MPRFMVVEEVLAVAGTVSEAGEAVAEVGEVAGEDEKGRERKGVHSG